jgi:hypothetical protein
VEATELNTGAFHAIDMSGARRRYLLLHKFVGKKRRNKI